ncbi:MAG: response regulator [Deltaproteobacteria bacterium]|nr:response regulator [Deltaproteobacteria bacterium]
MKKILVVDNDRIVLKFMTKTLEKEGFLVATARDGLTALDILKDDTPDIIFVDLVMPNIDGETLCRTIRSKPELNDTSLFILSAIAAEEHTDIAHLGVDACIAKGPFNIMARHVLSVIQEPDFTSRRYPTGEVIGLNDLHPRGITKELLSAKKHFELILNKMTEGIMEITAEGRLIYVNPFALSLINMPEKKLLGTHFADLFSEDDRLRIIDFMKIADGNSKAITEDAPVQLNENEVTLDIYPLEKNGFKRIVILSDVTDRKRMEVQLQQAQKMEAIGTLAGGIAHDFNNLLMGIQGRTSLMLMGADADHPHVEHLRGIEEYIRSAADLNNQLLGFASSRKYEVRLTDINALATKSVRMFGRTRKEINIREKLDENLRPAKVDRVQIEQVLLNLFVNAWHSMPGGGDLIVQTKNETVDEYSAKFYHVNPGKYVKISVIDTGVGMDEATQKRIFDPFFTTKKMGRGTGLGLASAYGIIKNHAGFINVNSEPGKGTTFNVSLPASEKKVMDEKTLPENILKGSETVLLVDDEEIIIDVGQQVLTKLGYTVMTANSGKEAIVTYEENKDKIDLVILDMIMPEMDGGSTFDKLKEIDPEIRVLLSSGYSINGQADEILNRGCNGFIQKPFSMTALSKKIREILDKK